MKKINLISGSNIENEISAFDRGKMSKRGIDSVTITKSLSKALKPFSVFLADDCGVALIYKDGKASIVGIQCASENTKP